MYTYANVYIYIYMYIYIYVYIYMYIYICIYIYVYIYIYYTRISLTIFRMDLCVFLSGQMVIVDCSIAKVSHGVALVSTTQFKSQGSQSHLKTLRLREIRVIRGKMWLEVCTHGEILKILKQYQHSSAATDQCSQQNPATNSLRSSE